MPITTINSYPETMTEFSIHIGQANAAIGGAGIILTGNFGKPEFDALKTQVETSISGIEGFINDLETNQSDRDAMRLNMIARLQMFRTNVASFLPGSRWLRALPKSPAETSAEGKFLAPLDDMADLWAKIDASAATADFTPPLVFVDGYTLAGFQTDLQQMRAYFDGVSSAERELKLGREDRDRLLEDALKRMREYRLRIEALFLETDPIRQSLPDLYPAPGSTPDSVTASGVWDAGTSEAVITWTASSDPNFDHYEVRMTPGATYDTENDAIVGNLPAGVLELRTDAGLSISGDVASFKVYVVLTTANEAGSNTVTITRPEL